MKSLLVSVFMLMATHAIAQQTKGAFTISGVVSGQDTGTITFQYVDINDELKTEQTSLHNGRFSFKGFIKEPNMASLIGKIKYNSIEDPNHADFFLSGNQINIRLVKDSFKYAIITGSPTEKESMGLKRLKAAIDAEMAPLKKELSANLDSLDKDPKNKLILDRHTAVIAQFQPFQQKLRAIDYQFMATHPHSFVCPYLLRLDTRYLSVDSVRLFYNSFAKDLKESSVGMRINRYLNGLPGGVAAGFATKDVNGNPVALAAFINKNYVLLDFWASWCAPCRANSPHLVELYDKYHSKGLEVIGIANDDQRIAAWKKAMADDKTTSFHQVLQGVGTKNNIGDKFAIQAIPTKILIDKKGRIVYRSDNDDDTLLDQKLAAIFN